MNRLLVRILWNRQSKWHFLVAGGGLLLGMFILLFSLQLYIDVRNVFFASENDPDAASHIIIHKKPYQPNFSQEEIDSLKQQPFIFDVAPFQTSLFQMEANLPIDAAMNDFLFLESLPTEFLDTVPENFKWEEGDNFIPIIVSSFYINLYNLNIAGSQGLPQFPPEMIKMFPFEITIKDTAKSMSFKAQVVAFSDRVPTWIVPSDFMQWANQNYGIKKDNGPNRLMLKVNDPGEQAFLDLLKAKEYQYNLDQATRNIARGLLNVLMTVLGIIGVLFMVLSFVLFILSFQLVISQAKDEISMLMDIGYTWDRLSSLLNIQFAMIIGGVISLVIALIIISRNRVTQLSIEKGFSLQQGGIAIEILVLGGIIFLVLLLLNYLSLRSALKR